MQNLKELNAAYSAALELLGRREYCRAQLLVKLVVKHSREQVLVVLDRLEQEGSLSDKRFSEMYTRHRMLGGFGPLKVSYQLAQKGARLEDVQSVIASDEFDWGELALTVATKRWQLLLQDDEPSELSREEVQSTLLNIKRFLKQRGFTYEQIAAATNSLM